MGLRDMLADGVRVGPDDVIDIGAVRDAAGHYRRGTTTLREIAGLMLDELAARGVPIPPPAPKEPAPERAPEPEPGMSPLVARVLDRHRRVLPTKETICEMFGLSSLARRLRDQNSIVERLAQGALGARPDLMTSICF